MLHNIDALRTYVLSYILTYVCTYEYHNSNVDKITRRLTVYAVGQLLANFATVKYDDVGE